MAAAAGWVPWPWGWHAAAVCQCYGDTTCADVTFGVDKDGGASLMSIPLPCSFPSPSVSTHHCHIPGHVTFLQPWLSLWCAAVLWLWQRALRCPNSYQKHGHTGKKEEYFFASSVLWHTNTCSPCLLGQGDVILPLHSASQTESSPAPRPTSLLGFPSLSP